MRSFAALLLALSATTTFAANPVAEPTKLPADWQAKVTELEKMLVSVKEKAAALPAMPKIGQ